MENFLPTAHTFGRILASAGWTLVGVLILFAGIRFYDLLDPVDYRSEILKGNVAAAIKISAVVLSLAAIVIMAILT